MALYPEHSILIVDDDVSVLQSLELTLLSMGITNIILCSDSRKVEKLLLHHDVMTVLLDLEMPYISGESILEFIKDQYPQMPVIIITASENREIAKRCVEKGARFFFLKPVNKEELQKSLSSLINNTIAG